MRALAQSGLRPANCRLLDPAEAALTGAAPDGTALLVLGFESADHPLDAWIAARRGAAAATTAARSRTAHDLGRRRRGAAQAAAGAWRNAFLQAPYLRDTLDRRSACVERHVRDGDHLGSASPRFVRRGARRAPRRRSPRRAAPGACPAASPTSIPTAPAPYFTVLAPARRGAELEQWDAIKAAASDAIAPAGGTITHHHAVGRDHRPWYDRQRPEPFAAALRAAKRELDPRGSSTPEC